MSSASLTALPSFLSNTDFPLHGELDSDRRRQLASIRAALEKAMGAPEPEQPEIAPFSHHAGGSIPGPRSEAEAPSNAAPSAPVAPFADPHDPAAERPACAAPRLSRAEQSRINGAKSRGPATDAGKAVSSRNALKHGLTASHAVLIPGEDFAEFDAYAADIIDELEPETTLQLTLARRAAEISWRLQRMPGLESSILEGCAVDLANPQAVAGNQASQLEGLVCQIFGVHNDGVLLRLQRYEVRLEKSLNATIRQLQSLQSHRMKRDRERGESSRHSPSAVRPTEMRQEFPNATAAGGGSSPSTVTQAEKADGTRSVPATLEPISGSFCQNTHDDAEELKKSIFAECESLLGLLKAS